MCKNTTNSERIGDSFPDLRTLSRGPLWRFRHRRPASFKALIGLGRYAIYIVVAIVYIKATKPIFGEALSAVQIEFSWEHTVMLGVTSGILTLIVAWLIRITYGVARDALFSKWAKETSVEERSACAKTLVAGAYSITEEDFIDPGLVERGLKAGESREALLKELVSAIERFQTTSFRAAEKLMSEDPKDFVPALKKLVSDDYFSILNRWRGINGAAERFATMVTNVEKKSRIVAIKERVRQELEQAIDTDNSKRQHIE